MFHLGKRIIPVVLEEAKPPALLADLKHINLYGDFDSLLSEIASGVGND